MLLSWQQRGAFGRGCLWRQWVCPSCSPHSSSARHITQHIINAPECWMNAQITNEWQAQRFTFKASSHFTMHLGDHDKAFQFHQQRLHTPHHTELFLIPLQWASVFPQSLAPSPDLSSPCLIHILIIDKLAIPPLACLEVIPWYFREYPKNRANASTWQIDTQWKLVNEWLKAQTNGHPWS